MTNLNPKLETSVRNLPIFKHFNENEIATKVTSKIDSFRKGEKPLFTIILLGIIGVVGYFTFVYAFPPHFQKVGQISGTKICVILILAALIASPVIIKWIKLFTRFLHKHAIKFDPFAELYKQKELMLQNQRNFRLSKGTILELKNDSEIEADKNEKDAKALQNRILSLDKKAKTLKSNMDEMIKNSGVSSKGTDEYVDLNSDLLKTVSESERIAYQLNQAKDFVQKYGSRALIMKKFSQKLTMVETSMDIKIADFDATIEILKKDYEFAQKSKNATDAAKSAMLFTKTWELEYALDVVSSTIASDIAITAGNLRDIDAATKTYAVDSDELYNNLDTLANNIRVGKDEIPEAKKYRNPDYKLTQDDKMKSNGFDNIF
jgi:hypothetical protein